jgi:signal transduction histidine kinase
MGVLVDENIDLEKLITDAEAMVDRRNPEALSVTNDVMRVALKSSKPRHLAHAKYILAFYNCLVANDYEKSIAICRECLASLNEEDGQDIKYKIYMTMGNSYQLKGDVFAAQECYLLGLKHLEARKELSDKEKGFLAAFYYNVSLLLSTSELKLPTEDYLVKAIELYQELGNTFKVSKSYVAYSGIFESRGEFDKAIEILLKALVIDEANNDAYSIALTKGNLGVQHIRTGRHDVALQYLKESLGHFEAKGLAWETAMVKIHLGETMIAIGNKDAGIAQLLSAEKLFNQLDNKRELSNVYEMLANCYHEKNQFEKAFAYQKKYTESLKYFFDTDKTNALTRAKKEFENEQNEKESLLLKEKSEEINKYVYKLEISNNELKQFAHVASHDLREPLRMIYSYMGLLNRSLKGRLNDSEAEFISFALDGAKRMEQLIVDLLRLAKIDANPNVQPVKLQGVLIDVKQNLETLVREKNALISSTELPEIMADRTQILQLFQNIIGNGIKYNESARPGITIEYTPGKENFEISIADNGIGIPDTYRERVFQIFQRLHTAKEYSGSGIGLAICKKIVDSMGGNISIHHNPIGGTIFKIVLPNERLIK